MKETNFKLSPLGPIPHDWEISSLGEISNTSSGGTPSRSNKQFYNGTINWFTTGELNDGMLTNSSEKISEEALICSSAKIFPSHTLLIAMYGATIGKVGIIVSPSATNQACCALLDLQLNTSFVKYWLIRNRPLIVSKGYGAGQPNISQKIVKGLPICFPSRPEQERIANALSDVDELIATTEALLQKKRDIKQGTMQQLLSGKRRLPGFSEPWKEISINSMGFTYPGLSGKTKQDFVDGKALYITFLNILNNIVVKPSLFEKVRVSDNENQHKARKGDVFFNNSSETPQDVGHCAVLGDDFNDLYVNSFCFGFRLTNSNVVPHFLAYVFETKRGRDLMIRCSSGVTRFNLSKRKFRESTLLIPPTTKEQYAILDILTYMDAELEALEGNLAKYKAIREAMMQQLLTGKIRLI